jgi:hypothetical protein
MNAKPANSIQITMVPAGEAPLWVREKWVGVVLPVVDRSPRRVMGHGVLSGPATWIGGLFAWLTGRLQPYTGYLVESRTAIAILEASSPEAAGWWKENGAHSLRPRRYFVFQECEGRLRD